jgi:TolA-binding protein
MKRRLLIFIPLLMACGPFFFMAPPPLDAYPQRIPGKFWTDILDESRPPHEDAATAEALIHETAVLAAGFLELAVEQRLDKIDALLARNREGEYHPQVANLLLELREMAAQDEVIEAATRYIEWRIAHLEDREFGQREVVRLWNMSDLEFAERQQANEAILEKAPNELEEIAVVADGRLDPWIRVQHAAVLMAQGFFERARQAFQSVFLDYPGHPRAEVASFMAGRCALEEAREIDRRGAAEDAPDRSPFALRAVAVENLETYLVGYPNGRFVADAHGWLGAVAADREAWLEAVLHQARRLREDPSRIAMRSALRECDWLFAKLFETGEDRFWIDPADLALLVSSPEVVKLLVYQALDPAAREELPQWDLNERSDRSTIDFLHRRMIRPRRIAQGLLAEVAKGIASRPGGQEDPTILLVLAWAAVGEGDVAEALILFDRGLEQVVSDEFLQGKAQVLGRLGRHAEAAEYWRFLVAEFPSSPLAVDASFEEAVARFRAGEEGEAVLIFLQLLEDDRDAVSGTLRPEFERVQWLDTVAQFAPIAQLKQSFDKLAPDDFRHRLLAELLISRGLAERDFSMVREILAAVGNGLGEWESLVGPLEQVERMAQSEQSAAAHLAAARQWQALRGKASMPSLSWSSYARSEVEKQDLLRRQNAQRLGIPDERVVAELDSRDELHHALDHYLTAVRLSEDPQVTAAALEGANEALFRMAEFSPFRSLRAVECGHGDLSQEWVARLKQEFEATPEALRAVAWKFVPPRLMGVWMPGDYTPSNSAIAIEQALTAGDHGTHGPDGDEHAARGLRLLIDRLAKLAEQREMEPEMDDLATETRLLADEFSALRPHLSREEILAHVDHFDDLVSVLEAPGLTVPMFRKYVAVRLGGGALPTAKGEWETLAPWLEFLKVRGRSSDVDHLPLLQRAAWQEYLESFPDSPKAEAASFRIVRSQVRDLLPVPQVEAFYFPEAPILGGYKRLKRQPKLTSRFLRILEDSIADHRRRFPAGRYEADLRLLDAALAAETGRYEDAVESLSAAVDDPLHHELRLDAALQFAEIGLRLLDREVRPEIAAAFRKHPAALEKLRRLIHGDTCLSRLRPLLPWLENGA